MKARLEEENVNPRDIKMELAKEIVRLYHGEEASIKAEENFKIYSNKVIYQKI